MRRTPSSAGDAKHPVDASRAVKIGFHLTEPSRHSQTCGVEQQSNFPTISFRKIVNCSSILVRDYAQSKEVIPRSSCCYTVFRSKKIVRRTKVYPGMSHRTQHKLRPGIISFRRNMPKIDSFVCYGYRPFPRPLIRTGISWLNTIPQNFFLISSRLRWICSQRYRIYFSKKWIFFTQRGPCSFSTHFRRLTRQTERRNDSK